MDRLRGLVECSRHRRFQRKFFSLGRSFFHKIRQLITNILQLALEDKNSRQRTTWGDVGFLQQASNGITMTEYFSTYIKTKLYVFIFDACFAKPLMTAWELGLTFLLSDSSTTSLKFSIRRFIAAATSEFGEIPGVSCGWWCYGLRCRLTVSSYEILVGQNV